MIRRIPHDAFSFYWSLGGERSYQTLADKYGVSKRAVCKVAKNENWKQKIKDIEKKAYEATEKKMAEDLEMMCERHIKVCKLIQRKALEALQSMPLTTALEAVRALDMSIKQERLIRGEPTDRTTVSTEEIVKKEFDSWMVRSDIKGTDSEEGNDEKQISEYEVQ